MKEYTFKERFITIVPSVKKYYNNIVDKLEGIFQTELEVMCDLPQRLLDMLEFESGRVWTDKIYSAIYAPATENFDVELLYEEIMKLPELE